VSRRRGAEFRDRLKANYSDAVRLLRALEDKAQSERLIGEVATANRALLEVTKEEAERFRKSVPE
jgi:hypothetical protein